MSEEIEFLKELQQELKTQDHDYQAAPRFWTVGDYRWIRTSEDDAERYSVYLPNDAECYELQAFLKEVPTECYAIEDVSEFQNIDCETEAIEWIQNNIDEDAELIPEKKEHFTQPNTMFLTKQEAKDHIRLNHYHYTDEVHTYAMTAWRAPKVERLLNILETFDWNKLK